MKPVAIFRYARTEGPGYFATFVDSKGIPSHLIRVDQGDPIPDRADAFSGLVLMGGHMSVNDELPWIAPLLSLIRDAVGRDIPVLGHCLGGQLMSKALGGVVSGNPVKEIGWGNVSVSKCPEARTWFGETENFVSFHWHGETFSVPAGGTRILGSAHCVNQAFAVGKHLGLQCHVEMTEDMVRTWCRSGADEVEQFRSSPGVQPVEDILHDLAHRVGQLNAVADTVYTRWIRGLKT